MKCLKHTNGKNYLCVTKSYRATVGENELPAEAEVLRKQATVIAITEGSGNGVTLETIAQPDRIINLSLEDMTDSVFTIVCPSEEKVTSTGMCFFRFVPFK